RPLRHFSGINILPKLLRRDGPLLVLSYQDVGRGLADLDGAPIHSRDALAFKLGSHRRGRRSLCSLGGPRWRVSQPRSTLPKLPLDRKSTRLNSSHVAISYAVFCLKKKMAS